MAPRSPTERISRTRSVMLGLVAGLVGGMFGVGGGIVIVPGLVLWLGLSQHEAAGTSVAVIIAAAASALGAFALDGAVDWGAAAVLTIGAVIGAGLGARVMGHIPERWLIRAFTIVLLVAAVRLGLNP